MFFKSKQINFTTYKGKINAFDTNSSYPNERIKLEVETSKIEKPDNTARLIDLVSPIGKGQRSLIVSPLRAGNNNFQILHSQLQPIILSVT